MPHVILPESQGMQLHHQATLSSEGQIALKLSVCAKEPPQLQVQRGSAEGTKLLPNADWRGVSPLLAPSFFCRLCK